MALTATSPAEAAPEGGPYADRAVESTGSELEFTVNAAGTRIARGATLRTGFPCAPRTVRTTKGVPIVDDSFSYRGPVERTSGKPAGSLRWTGTWTRDYDVDGDVRLQKGDCSSGKVSFAAMAVLPQAMAGLQASAVAGGGVNLEWPMFQGAAYYYVMRSTVSGGPYPYEAYSSDVQHSDNPPKAAQYFYFVRAFDAQGAALANSNEASVYPF